MKVLIVDDVEANRTTLKWILTKANIQHIEEACNGQSAIEACEVEKYDLVFMDVMMSGMTGMEATKKIKQLLPQCMVVAVTALDDEDTATGMFVAGAEDYVSKPIRQEIFKARLQIYFKVIENRKLYNLSATSISLFSKPVFNRFTTLKIKEESHLAEFWEYHYGCSNIKNESLCDTVSKIYTIGTMLLSKNSNFFIFFEENETALFFTVDKTDILSQESIQDVLKKDGFKGNYLVGKDKVSFMVEKTLILTQNACVQEIVENQTVSKEPEQAQAVAPKLQEPELFQEVFEPIVAERASEELFVYNFMDEHDFGNLEDYIKDLDSILILIQSSKIEAVDAKNISHKIEKVASVLSIYTETYELGMALRALSSDINENTNEFIGQQDMVSNMFFSFVRDLLEWFSQIFKTGAPSVGFMDATIIANTAMISNTIKPRSEADDSNSLEDMLF